MPVITEKRLGDIPVVVEYLTDIAVFEKLVYCRFRHLQRVRQLVQSHYGLLPKSGDARGRPWQHNDLTSRHLVHSRFQTNQFI